MNFIISETIKKNYLNKTTQPTFLINQNQIKENTISFENNDMNIIKKKYENSNLSIVPAIYSFKKGMVERVNIKTKGCGSCGK